MTSPEPGGSAAAVAPHVTRAAVLGTGSWGTTFAAVLADAGCDVVMWGRNAEVCREIESEHRNQRYLPGIELPQRVRATTDAADALRGAELVAIAVPAQSARETLTAMREHVDPTAIAVSLMKGVELSTDRRMSEVVAEALGLLPARVAVLSGPNLAREIAEREPTATVVASEDATTARIVAQACATPYFRPYTNADVIGVELCGAVKNVVALAVGIAQGLGLGQNTTATIMTRGLVEIARLGRALGADGETFSGLAGMGDLVATCSSPLSRNHTLGMHVGRGMSLDEAVDATGGTAEGVKSCTSVLDLARRVGADMPITEAVVAVLHEGLPVQRMAEVLLSRPHRAEGVEGAREEIRTRSAG